MTSRSKIAIFGADAAAFHIFNVLYRSDDRYEVVFFLNIDGTILPGQKTINYPSQLLNSSIYNDISIIPYSTSDIKPSLPAFDNKIEKCIFTPACLTSSMYLHLAAQAMAYGASVITHKLDATLIPPPKALVSYFSDTQFDGQILFQIIQRYKESGNKPAIVFGGNIQLLQLNLPYIQVRNAEQFQKIQLHLDSHTIWICERLVTMKIPFFFVLDFEQFASDAQRDESYDLLIFNGFNSLPCFFSSHLTIYSCDDFTFGSEISEHPSSVLLSQSDVVLCCCIENSKCIENLQSFAPKSKVIGIEVGHSAVNLEYYGNRPVLLIDDAYPVERCNATRSISEYIAVSHHMKPVEIEISGKMGLSPLFSEPTERNWRSLIYPDKNEAGYLVDRINKSSTQFDVVLATTSRNVQIPLDPAKKAVVMQINFSPKFDLITKELLTLPSAAFVKRR